MIEKKTVFVVGAGASTNFNLPTGAELKADIAELMGYTVPDPWTVKGQFSRIFQQLKTAQNNGQVTIENINQVLGAAREIRAAMPLSQSIDNYLDAHRHDPITNIVGKMGICQAIVEREGRSNIRSPDRSNVHNEFDFIESQNTWTNALLRKLTEGVPLSAIDTLFQNVAIVTFNYDRCIEQFLYFALQRYYRLPEQEVVTILNKLQVVHVYGRVGNLPWQVDRQASIPYGRISDADLVGAAKGMSTFTELSANSQIAAEIAVAFAQAQRVVFLGFSFQEQNVSVLPTAMPSMDIFGTALGMSETNLRVIEQKLPTHFGGARQLVLDAVSVETFIDSHWRVIE